MAGAEQPVEAVEPDQSKCIIPDCDRTVCSRGLCRRCHQLASRKVKAGKSTWAELESHGLCLPARQRAKFLVAFEERLGRRPAKGASPAPVSFNDVVSNEPERDGDGDLVDEAPYAPPSQEARRRIRAFLKAAGPSSIDQIAVGIEGTRRIVVKAIMDDPFIGSLENGRYFVK